MNGVGFKFTVMLALVALPLIAEDPARRLIVSIPDRKLVLVEDGKVIRMYPVAVGKQASPTPAGQFSVISRIEHPTWWGPKGKVVPPGTGNPLGTRWIGLSERGYGIHGTNVPRSIGRAASHGCVRMRNQDVEELFRLVHVGDTVELVGEMNDEIAKLFGVEPPAKVTTTADAGGE